MNQIQRALRDGIRVEGGERLGWIAWDDILGCYHNKHNNAREAIRWARECRSHVLAQASPLEREKMQVAIAEKRRTYDQLHSRDATSDAARR